MDGTNTHGTWSMNECGATLTSWAPDGRDVLFTSTAGTHPSVHGGIPICAPWFGKGRDEAEVPRSHGLVKWVPWHLVSHESTEAGDRLVWTVSGKDTVGLPGAEAYPADLEYTYTVKIGQSLTVSLEIVSPTTEVIVDHAFHTYFAVSDLGNVEITGLDGTRTRDYARGGIEGSWDGVVTATGYHDTIYFGATGPITLTDVGRDVVITPDGSKDCVIWNPGPDYAAKTAGMNPDDWHRFICIELGNVQRHAVTIPAGGRHSASMTIEIRANETIRSS